MVLVVDDEPDARSLLMRLLRVSGYEGHAVAGGKAAMDWLKDHRPDLVILDVNMPDIYGMDVLKMIRADRVLDGVAVVMHTALDDQVFAHLAAEAGASGTLFKGRYSVQDVFDVLSKHCAVQ